MLLCSWHQRSQATSGPYDPIRFHITVFLHFAHVCGFTSCLRGHSWNLCHFVDVDCNKRAYKGTTTTDMTRCARDERWAFSSPIE